MRALQPLMLGALILMSRTARADPATQAARAKLAADCDAFAKDYEASRSPKLLAELGLCGVRLERDGDAIDAYSRYLHENPDLTGGEHDRMVHDLQNLQVGVGYLTLEADQPGVTVSDERVVPVGDGVVNEYGPIDGKLYLRVRPGHHIFKTKLTGFQETRWEIDVFSATHETHIFDMRRVELVLAPPPRPGRGGLYGPWVLMGLGGAMLVGGTITGIAALQKSNDAETASDRTSAKTFAGVTDVLLIGGALAAAGGLTWLLLERRSEHASASIGPMGASLRVDF